MGCWNLLTLRRFLVSIMKRTLPTVQEQLRSPPTHHLCIEAAVHVASKARQTHAFLPPPELECPRSARHLPAAYRPTRSSASALPQTLQLLAAGTFSTPPGRLRSQLFYHLQRRNIERHRHLPITLPAGTAPASKRPPPTVLATTPLQARPHRPTSRRTRRLQLPRSWWQYSDSVERSAHLVEGVVGHRCQDRCE